MAALNSMIHRAFSIPLSKQDLREELNVIRTIGRNNQFPLKIIDTLIIKKEKRFINRLLYRPHYINSKNDRNELRYVSIPYTHVPSSKIIKFFKNNNLNIAFSSHSRLDRMIFNNKLSESEPMKKSGIYRLDCEECKSSYVGQTGRCFETRLKEHVKNGQSAFREHLESTGHKISSCFKPKILHYCEKGIKMNYLEAMEINKLQKSDKYDLLNDQLDLNHSPLLNL
ncbi:hypothetical protein WA026_005315 [Henosepilachna vigintioctopunctata]|uniref:GIY-YIG domain-containing protein n=1 Tax=Henosepilachna vigintioctopunctata TaxID=420089 RepID=A0AAW1ULL5_9CUCU